MIDYPPEKTQSPEFPATSYNQYPSAGGASTQQYRQAAYDNDLPPAYDAPSSSSSSRATPSGNDGREASSSQTSMLSRMRASAGANPADILNPPPPAFSRPPPNNVSYAPFPPCALVSLSNALDKGFPPVAPPSSVQPHPFALHDVREEDWVRFLSDVKRAGSLSPMNRIVAGVAPMAMGIGLLGILVSRGMERRMKAKKVGPTSELIEHWNYYFFYPRMMEITLVHGDGQGSQGRHGRSNSLSSSSSSSDSDDHQSRRERRDARRAERRERRADRRQEKAARRERRREGRKDRGEKWQLIVSFRPSTPQAPAYPGNEFAQSQFAR